MINVQTVEELRCLRKAQQVTQVAFVPTMGNLHEGHFALIRAAKQSADSVVASIFVNPMQFAVNEDLDKYPRTLEQDQQALKAEGVDILFAPDVADIYPRPFAQQTRIEVPNISKLYCGASRPGHFVGVATVVAKLFNLVQPNIAVLGKKDFQQLWIIRRMVEDLAMPIDIIGVDTVRAVDGLAMSSRNQYLTEAERQIAPVLYQQLQSAAQALQQGVQTAVELSKAMRHTLDNAGFTTDYIEILDVNSLLPAQDSSQHLVILAAAQLGAARLIDNIEVHK